MGEKQEPDVSMEPTEPGAGPKTESVAMLGGLSGGANTYGTKQNLGGSQDG
jgi:hypothetical protein